MVGDYTVHFCKKHATWLLTPVKIFAMSISIFINCQICPYKIPAETVTHICASWREYFVLLLFTVKTGVQKQDPGSEIWSGVAITSTNHGHSKVMHFMFLLYSRNTELLQWTGPLKLIKYLSDTVSLHTYIYTCT